MAKLNRKSLPQQVAEVMEEDIRSGALKESLPGYRLLQERYNVSKVTCERAIAILERRKVISKAEPRKRRSILLEQETVQNGIGTLLVINDISESYVIETQEHVSQVSAFWRQKGGDVQVKPVDLTRTKSPSDLFERWTSSGAIGAIVMIMPPKEWVRAALATNLPVFRVGGWLGEGVVEGTVIAYLASDVWSVVLSYLKSLGHERVLVPWKYSNNFVRKSVMDAYRASHSDCLTDEDFESLVPLVDHRNADDWHKCWSGLLSRTQPTAVAITKPLEAISLMLFCARAGIKIPSNLSVFLVNPSDLSEWITPRLTCMVEENRFSQDAFEKWVEGGFVNKGLLKVPKMLKEGESVKDLNP